MTAKRGGVGDVQGLEVIVFIERVVFLSGLVLVQKGDNDNGGMIFRSCHSVKLSIGVGRLNSICIFEFVAVLEAAAI